MTYLVLSLQSQAMIKLSNPGGFGRGPGETVTPHGQDPNDLSAQV